MRLRSISIDGYKNLYQFSLDFAGDEFIDIFVGKNGSGKSNFLEALIEIFDHIYTFKADNSGPDFDYSISWDIRGAETQLEWKNKALSINIAGKAYKTLQRAPLPANIIVYYSGQNDTVSDLIRRYRDSYRGKVRRANVAELPRFIGIGPDYKALLLALMLMMPENTSARRFVCDKLGIEGVGGTTSLTLSRPGKGIVSQSRSYDPFEDGQLFWGINGVARQFLDQLMDCITGDFTPGSLYDRDTDTYRLDLDVAKFRETFVGISWDEVFCQFNALQALGMIEDVSIPVRLGADVEVTSRAFSDGQFQSIYLFAISELFKNRECLTLLDEPDAFLHPEWQHDFLSQVQQISDEAAKSNHILMSSHSASTVASKVPSRMHLLETNGKRTEARDCDKGELIKSLSAGLITFSEKDARLNIQHNLKNTEGPILFVEGVSDEIILEAAWEKLNPGVQAPFEIQSAFDCGFLGRLLRDEMLYRNDPDRKFFGLFDFDEAYNQWNFEGEDIETDPEKCLTRKHPNYEGYAMLLPVPAGLSVRSQVINPDTGDHYRAMSRLTIELLFRDVPELDQHFEIDPTRPGNSIRFKGRKTRFASRVVSQLERPHFEVFRPIFDSIRARI